MMLMRTAAWPLGACACVLAATLASARTTETCSADGDCNPRPAPAPQNNKRLISVQRGGTITDCAGANDAGGSVRLTYMGHSSFKLTTPAGVELLIDPWQNDDSGFWGLWYYKLYPATRADVLVSTHNHFDHNAFSRVDAPMTLDRMVGSYKFGDLEIEGYADKHAIGKYEDGLFDELGLEKHPPDNSPLLDHVMFKVRSGGVTVLFWGDNRHNPSEHVWDWLAESDIDVAVLPIDDSSHLMTYAQIEDVIKRLRPRAVVPVHYLMSNGLGSVLSKLLPCDGWLAAHARTLVDVGNHTVSLDADTVSAWDRDDYSTLYFASHVPFDVPSLDSASPKHYVCGN